jgi:hypothetical protein
VRRRVLTRVAAAVLAGLVSAGCSVFGDRSGYESSAYTVIDRPAPDLEIRTYAPRVAAEVRVPMGDWQSDAAFRTLFRYITGANEGAQDVAMTTPVEMTPRGASDGADIAMTTPVESSEDADGMMRMQFFLPASYTVDTAPVPTDPAVAIVAVPEKRFAVRRFAGFGFESSVARETRALLADLSGAERWRAAAAPVAMFYDPPWTLPFFRRNEVAVAVEPTGGS